MKGSLLVVSGPSGSGKSSLCKKLCAEYEFACLSISSATRAPREGEQDGKDYFFIPKAVFERKIAQEEFLEWANVHGNYYGTDRRWVEKTLASGKTVAFDIDVQGQAAIARLYPNETTSVFVTTSSIAILKDRLIRRGTDDAAAIAQRLENALGEMNCIDRYDYLLINDDFDASFETIKSVALASRVKRGKVELRKFIANWRG
ncbi:MAG: guanylate kinase [Helicobacteraceae bacterium]|nr:guanylate kinase [Helicobacteraceae bacterium]